MNNIPVNYEDDGPHFNIEVQSMGSLDMNWNTAALFTHPKNWRMLDHIYYAETEDSVLEVELELDDMALEGLGFYLFREKCEDFDDIQKIMEYHDYPHVHQPIPSDTDIEAYLIINTQDLKDFEGFDD